MIKMGSKVMISDKGRHKIPKEDEGKIFEVRSNSFEICGTTCVLLKGKRGGYAVSELIEVEEEKERAGKWIPCSERLPKNDGFYLATIDGEIAGEEKPFTGLAEFENGQWIDDEEDYKCILAWQPLPEPYQPKGEGEE